MSTPTSGPSGAPPNDGLVRRLRTVLLWLTVGAVVGAVLGSVFAATRPQQSSADAVISLAPAREVLDGATVSADETTALVQSELIVLAAPELRQQVEQVLGEQGDLVEYSAAQVGTSTIVDITASAPGDALAVRTVEVLVDVYARDRRERLRAEIARAAAVVDAELSRLEQDLDDQPVRAQALQQEYGRLLAVRSGLFRAEASVAQAVSLVRPAALTSAGLSPVVKLGGLGALLGALLGLALLTAVERSATRVRGRSDLLATGLPVLRPEFGTNIHPLEDLLGRGDLAADVRLLVGQVARAGAGPLVLFGVTPGVGASFVAASFAVSLSERAPVLLVLAADVVEGADGSGALELAVDGCDRGMSHLPDAPLTAEEVLRQAVETYVPGLLVLPRGPGPGASLPRLVSQGLVEAALATGRTVVIDAPSLSTSSSTVDVAGRSSGAVLVVGRGVTRRADLGTVSEVFSRQGLPLLGAILNDGADDWSHRWRALRRPGTGLVRELRQARRRITELERGRDHGSSTATAPAQARTLSSAARRRSGS